MSLQITYSKEVAYHLGKIAVCLPGSAIEVGDIIQFPQGKRGLFGKYRPMGTYRKYASLSELGINNSLTETTLSPDPYTFTSKKGVSIKFSTAVHADTAVDISPNGNGKVELEFSSEGAVYFQAEECTEKVLNNLFALEDKFKNHNYRQLWDNENNFLVVSVTTAKKAFIAQSQSKTSKVNLLGNIQGVKSSALDIALNASFQSNVEKGAAFVKDWSDNVTVFMDVIRLEREIFAPTKTRGIFNNNKFERDSKLVTVDYKEILKD